LLIQSLVATPVVGLLTNMRSVELVQSQQWITVLLSPVVGHKTNNRREQQRMLKFSIFIESKKSILFKRMDLK